MESLPLEAGAIAFVDGVNFSGRTKLLRKACGLPPGPQQEIEHGATARSNTRRGAYVGEDAAAGLTGLASTCRHELLIQAGLSSTACDVMGGALSQALRARGLWLRNPFNLSGGEQALLAVGAACATGADVVAIDTTLEQLAPEFFAIARTEIIMAAQSRRSLVIVDNRWDDGIFDFVTKRFDLPVPSSVRPAINPEAWIPEITPLELKIAGIWYRYPSRPWVLKDIEMVLRPGRIYHLRGANGAGKSTLAKLLAGLLRPHAGTILGDGRALVPWRFPAGVVAYHFQNPDHQLFRASVRAELDSAVSGATSDRLGRLSDAAEAFGLIDYLDCHPLDLPFVMRKRLALAATIAMDRPWIVIDEPTLGQDRDTARAIARLLARMADFGQGVILITHSNAIPRHTACQAIDLSDGRLRSA